MYMKKMIFFLLALMAGAQVWAQEPAKRTITVNGVSFNMVEVKGGRFNMGGTCEQYNCDDDEFPIHVVSLPDYLIGETEVTQRLWVAVMGDNPSTFTGDLDLPVDHVTWQNCQGFVSKLNELTGLEFRLPTEAEWEFAARGGIYTHYYQYSGSDNIAEVAWYGDNSDNQTHVVAQLKPNELGLYDMSGNVFEFCQDYYGSYDMMPVEAPTGPESGEERVRRGGAYSGSTKGPRISFRISELETVPYPYYGMRLAATVIDNDLSAVVGLSGTAKPAGQRYNVAGQPVGTDYKGIVIEDGQKTVVHP